MECATPIKLYGGGYERPPSPERHLEYRVDYASKQYGYNKPSYVPPGYEVRGRGNVLVAVLVASGTLNKACSCS